MTRSKATKKAKTLKDENKDKDEEDDYPKVKEQFDKKQAVVLPSKTNEQLPFDENDLFQ